MKLLKVKFLIILTAFCFLNTGNVQATAGIENGNEGVTASAASNAAITEAKYDRMMRIFISRLKLAFSETDDTKTVAILSQFSQQFHQQTDGLKQELASSVKQLSKEETAALYKRLVERSHNAELIALIFDERITSRVDKNPEIKQLLETLQAKSLEIQQTDLLALK
ncbi:hypothetical protein [Adhaeribacter soli]|nr:hypothetical protein [Adhaeribacter soli]